jgi:hypothetical protein
MITVLHVHPPNKSLLPCDGSPVKKIIKFNEIQDSGWVIVMRGYVDARGISTVTRGRYIEGSYKQTHRKFSSIYWGLLLVFLVYLIICCFLG